MKVKGTAQDAEIHLETQVSLQKASQVLNLPSIRLLLPIHTVLLLVSTKARWHWELSLQMSLSNLYAEKWIVYRERDILSIQWDIKLTSASLNKVNFIIFFLIKNISKDLIIWTLLSKGWNIKYDPLLYCTCWSSQKISPLADIYSN